MKPGRTFMTALLGAVIFCCLAALGGCSSSRHVPEGSYLLDKVFIRLDSTPQGPRIDTETLQSYLKQQPNHRMLWSIKFRLGFYNLSGQDTTKFLNRWARRLGEPPVIYSPDLTAASAQQLRNALVNQGYLHAAVRTDTLADAEKRKMQVTYTLLPGEAHTIRSMELDIADQAVDSIVREMESEIGLPPGTPLDRSLLENQRTAITERLRQNGYFAFSKENVTFSADTTEGSTQADLTLRIGPTPRAAQNPGQDRSFDLWMIRRVVVVTDFEPTRDPDPTAIAGRDTVAADGIEILYGSKRYLRPSVIAENCFLRPGELYSDRASERTYQALSRLQILNFVNIRNVPVASAGELGFIDTYILLTPGKLMSGSLELEGTNSAGDLGVAVGLGFTHRNLGRGSETLTARVSGSYEALSGHLDDLFHNRYMEYGADLSLSFPKFKAPFVSRRFKRSINASSALNLSVNFQDRPEYTRVISTAGWSYNWTRRDMTWRQTLTPIDINYVYLPRTTYDFLDRIAPDNPLLRYSYEDHFIMRMGYNLYYTNRRETNPWEKKTQRSFHTLRANIETAGNLLFGLSNLFDPGKNFSRDPYRVFNIRYSQYVKLEGDWAMVRVLDERNSLAFHAGGGVAVPYANSSIMPFEKRFYGGGANGVRGWSVRTLGPGSYDGGNTVSDFINQCGDIRLELNAEYRAKLFWVIELGAFIDAGNIWTIRNYESQPGGVFRFNKFYRQIAAAYGLGLRLDFNYFLLRFDLGMKAHNPAAGADHWPLLRPRWRRDSSFHFSIGYPF